MAWYLDPTGGPPPSKMEKKKEKRKRLKQSLDRFWPLSSEEELLVMAYRKMVSSDKVSKLTITDEGIISME